MAALIGALRVSLSADTAAFHSGMKRAERQARTSGGAISKSLSGIKAGFAGLAAGLSIGLLASVARQALEYAGSLGEISQQLGVTTRDLQVFRYAAGQVGIGQAELEKGLGKLTITLGQVAAGAKAPAKALDAIGISVKQLQGLDTGQAFRLIADGLEKIPDRAQRAAVEVALFGRAGAKLDNLLAGGSRAINELEYAADRLGIVLSDEQIQKADETADKLAAVKTVLQARIAGVVADNADAIVKLADAFATVAAAAASMVGAVASAANAINQFSNSVPDWMKAGANAIVPGAGLAGFIGSLTSGLSSSATVKLGPPRPFRRAGGSVKPFLASGGGGKKGGKGPRDTSLRDAFQFDEELRRTQMDVLRAQQDLAADYVARHIIAIQILDLEKLSQDEELKYKVAAGELTKAQAEKLKANHDQVDALKRQAELDDVETQRSEEYAELEKTVMEVGLDKLRSEEQLAETASESRAIRLKILDYEYRMERALLEAVLADEKSSELAKNQARARLAALSTMQSNDTQGTLNSTRGPLEDYLASLPTTAAKAEEALQRVKVNGLDALTEGLVDAAMGVRSLGDVFKSVASQIIADLLRIQIQKMIVGLLGTALGAPGANSLGGGLAGGFATGGFTGMGSRTRIAGFVHGQEGVLNAPAMQRLGVPALNALNSGAPISAVSNDNQMSGRRGDFIFNNYAPMTDRQARRTGLQVATAARQENARSAKVIG